MSSRLEWAQFYHSLGLSVFPLCPGSHRGFLSPTHRRHGPEDNGKVPVVLVQEIKRHPASEADLFRWWGENPDYNLAVLLGSFSGFIVLDVDDEYCIAKLREVSGGDLPATWKARTGGGGYHLWFKVPKGTVVPGRRWRTRGKILDLKGEGSYVVVPGSTHRTGRLYRWEEGLAPWEIGPASARPWMLQPKREQGGGVINQTSASRCRLPCTAPLNVVIERCRRCLAKRPPAIEGQGGAILSYKTACVCLHGFHLSEDDARTLFMEYNARCEPVWEGRELERLWEHARDKGNSPCRIHSATGRSPALG